METWLDWCIRAPAPRPGYEGYPGKPLRELSEILFQVSHSAEGWEAYLKQGHRPGESASWTFSNCQDGDMYQHFPLESITYTSGGRTQNIQGLGVEHEGVKGQPLNDKQVANDLRLWADLEALCPNLRPQVPGQGYREHSELTNGATSCPNGRIQPLYDAVAGGAGGDDDMPLSQTDLDAIAAIVDQRILAERGAIRQLCKEAIDTFTRGDADPVTQKIALASELKKAIDMLGSGGHAHG